MIDFTKIGENFYQNSDNKKAKEKEPTKNKQALESEYNLLRKLYIKKYDETGDFLWLAKALLHIDNKKKKINEIVGLPQILLELINFLKEYEDREEFLNIMLPVGSWKTSIVMGIFATHQYIQDKQFNSSILSENVKTAGKRKNTIYNNIMKYNSLTTKEPIKFMLNNTTEFNILGATNTDPSCSSFGIESGITGSHVDILFVDDLETKKTVSNPRELIKNFMTTTTNRLSGTGKIITINTPYHPQGLLTFLESNNMYTTLKISFPDELVNEKLLENVLENILSGELTEEHKNILEEDIKKKDLFQAISYIENNRLSSFYSEQIKSTMDFSYTKKIIRRGEVIEETKIPEWDYMVKTSGNKILTEYYSERSAYYLTKSLNTSKGTETNIFTYHRDCMINLEEYLKIKNNQKKIPNVYSYDLSSSKRNGTVITHAEFYDDCMIIKSQEIFSGTEEAEDRILIGNNDIHVPEATGTQKIFIESLKKRLLKKDDQGNVLSRANNIIPHITSPESKFHPETGISAMNKAFKDRKIVFLENGENIDKLQENLSIFSFTKTKKQQFDNVDSLWFLFCQEDNIRKMIKKRKTKEIDQSFSNNYHEDYFSNEIL